MTKDEALKLALEGAANYIDVLGGDSRKYRQLLAEQSAQQHEPVAVVALYPDTIDWLRDEPPIGTLLYTSPHQRKPWVGLTEDDIYRLGTGEKEHTFQFARAIEAKLKEKNA